MKLLLLLLVLVVIGLVVAVAAGSITGGLGDPARSTPDPGLPAGPLRAEDLERVRFTPALRGYRMDQVDALLDRLRDQLAVAEEEARRARLGRLVTDTGPVEPVGPVGPVGSAVDDPSAELVAEPEDASARIPEDAVAEVLQQPGSGSGQVRG